MTLREFFIKSVSLLFGIALSTVVIGREMLLSSPVMNESNATKLLVKDIKRADSASAKLENRIIGEIKISMIRSEFREFPFLCSCIKYNVYENDDYICLYNTNQVLYYSIRENVCIFYHYTCLIGDPVYTQKECYERAKRAIWEAFSGSNNVSITSCRVIDNDNGICTFCFNTDLTEDKNIIVSVRRDTNNIVLFDARGVEWVLCDKNKGAY